MARGYSLQQIAEHIGAELRGDGEFVISSLNTLQDAVEGQLAFLANQTYRKHLSSTGASAVIMHHTMAADFAGHALLMDNPYLGYALASQLFDDTPGFPAGIHPTAVVSDTAEVHPDAAIGPSVYIGEYATIGADTVIGPGCSISEHSSIGKGGWLAANVSVYHGVTIGDNVRIHSGAVIGSDGFGFAPENGQWKKIYQLGGVVIGNNVEIGACTTIDRGALGDTVIADGAILDNHVMIAHNVQVGENTAFAAFSGSAGSSVIGRNCVFAGRAGAVGHLHVCDGVQVGLGTTLTRSVREPGVYCSGTQTTKAKEWRKNAVRFNQLDDMYSRLKELEKRNK